MRYVDLGDSRVSIIGLGTRAFGSRTFGDGKADLTEASRRILERAIELGVNLIDTAELYGFGASEKLIGSALSCAPQQAFLATKILPLSYSRSYLRRRCQKSLTRLRAEVIDLYQMHFPNPFASLDSLADSLVALRDSGMVCAFGVSNFGVPDWDRLEAISGLRIESNQVRYSLLSRGPEMEHLPFALAKNRVIIAHSPLEQGVLAGKYDRGNRPGGIRRFNRHFSPDALERMQPLLFTLERVAASHQASPAQAALAWVISHPNVVAIPGASSVAQLEANVAAAEIRLSEQEVAELDYASELYARSAGNRLFRSIRTRAGI